MILLHILTIFFTLRVGYLGFFYSKNVVVGFLIVLVLGIFFPIALGVYSFLVFSMIVNVFGYLIIIKFTKKNLIYV
ncbi:hypothetical protein GCM10011346_35110 [Oceanobacillus neutriphilus]|uniref:Polysaccharide biosynthesis protein C-terminal domain-containing protein n=1 Tax=Oceanobacillus neutriphilus TaxID=531815 RepID=A0ABQ2NYH5_9BACI|nr:hypothetical protein GCM10011346_35110 [Oceanobacillus neutriphilus]